MLGVPTGPPAAGDGPVASPGSDRATPGPGARDPLLAAWRAQIEGSAFQSSGPDTVLGGGGFADDTAPRGALVAVPGPDGRLVVAGGLTEARGRSGKVQGRNSTVPLTTRSSCPKGSGRSPCGRPGSSRPTSNPTPAGAARAAGRRSPLANGGAFGGKRHSPVPGEARRLADEHGRAVRVLWPREEVVRHGPKRPPVAVGMRADGTGVLRVARDGRLAGPGSGDPGHRRPGRCWPTGWRRASGLVVEEVEVAGPPVSPDLRGAGWVEASVVVAALAARPEGRGGPGDGDRDHRTVGWAGHGGGGRRRRAVAVEVWAGEVARPGHPALLLHRGRAPGAGVGPQRGDRRRRRRRGARPDHPLVRDPRRRATLRGWT